ncbi:metal-dependent hydrolase [Natronomonas marina]|uniref:metal-dependent hydrolase n=1 Tax=Natronomonas marina TaxID=2961939 RepID=UPI0020C983A1|nr:metal-dependent hydrolase [Natronomonas marina]
MFVGHGLVAFAIVAGLAALAGWDRERALAVGLLAGAFGLSPDVDILYAPVGLVGVDGLLEAEAAFWAAGNVVHRAVTHSLVVGALGAVGAALWAARTKATRALAVTVGTGLVAVGATDGALSAVVMAAFVVVVFGVASAGTRWGIDAPHVGAAAVVGLLAHPFGDLFTGAPPELLYPFDVTLVAERLLLHPDPTMHLLGAFGLEIATMWAAALVYLHVTDRRLTDHVRPHATLGVGFAGAVLLLPPPSLEAPYRFVFGALGVGMVSGVGVHPRNWWRLLTPDADRRPLTPLGVALTGLAALSAALLAYGTLYTWL